MLVHELLSQIPESVYEDCISQPEKTKVNEIPNPIVESSRMKKMSDIEKPRSSEFHLPMQGIVSFALSSLFLFT